MEITIAEAMKFGGLKNCKLIAGKKGIQNRIRCVDTMEVPDITPWLKKNELLVTTGYSIKNDTNALIKLISSLNEVGAAGLAVKTRFIGNISQEVIDKADRLCLPVIEVPPDMPFMNITYPLIRLCYWQVLLEKFRQIILLRFFHFLFSKILILDVQAYSFCHSC